VYEAFYGLRTRPFGKTPDPSFLFQSQAHAEALARLLTAAEDGDLAVLTGDIGAGKTLLTRALVDELSASRGERARVILLVNPRLTPAELLSTLADRLGVSPLPKSKPKLLDAIFAALYEAHAAGETVLLIVDEAHLLPTRAVFEELRLLLNLTLDDAPLLGMLLVGQDELRARLAKKDLRAFAQRIGAAFHLTPLQPEEVGGYLRGWPTGASLHRWRGGALGGGISGGSPSTQRARAGRPARGLWPRGPADRRGHRQRRVE
jgi:type II secretory pathway predicted ATPase ExeA